MQQTYRSDMKRRNDRWDEVTGYLAKLCKAVDINDLIHLIDRINNCVHNTGELMLSKFKNGNELLKAYNFIHRNNDINELANRASIRESKFDRAL